MHWPHQHFELLRFVAHPQQHIIYYKQYSVVGPGLQVYGLATPPGLCHYDLKAVLTNSAPVW